MKSKLFCCLLLLAGLFVSSCSKSDYIRVNLSGSQSSSVNVKSLSIGPKGTSMTLYVVSSTAWTASYDGQLDLSMSVKAGESGEATVLTIGENTSASQLSGSISFTAGSSSSVVSLTQRAPLK